jgi:hypothetical protein
MPGVTGSLSSRLDTVVGNGVEAAVRVKHRTRLRRLGWLRAIDPGDDGLWAKGQPPRDGCTMEPLIDGAHALPEMAQAMEAAKQSVHMTSRKACTAGCPGATSASSRATCAHYARPSD